MRFLVIGLSLFGIFIMVIPFMVTRDKTDPLFPWSPRALHGGERVQLRPLECREGIVLRKGYRAYDVVYELEGKREDEFERSELAARGEKCEGAAEVSP